MLLPQEVPSTVKSLQKNIVPQGPELYSLKVPSLSPAALSAAPACRSELSPRRATPLIPHLSQQIQDTRSTFLFQGKSDFLQSLAFTLAPLILQAVCFTCDKFVFL